MLILVPQPWNLCPPLFPTCSLRLPTLDLQLRHAPLASRIDVSWPTWLAEGRKVMYMQRKQKGRINVKEVKSQDVCGHIVVCLIETMWCDPMAWAMLRD